MSRLRDGEVLAHLEYDLRGADCDGRRRLRSTSAAKFILGCAELLIAAGNDSVVPGSVREILYSVCRSVSWSVGIGCFLKRFFINEKKKCKKK